MGLGGSSVGDTSTALAQQTQADQDQGLQQINQAFSGFTPGFYNQVQQDYTNYATPQLEQQYQDESKQLQGGLASQGLQKSSAGAELTAQLGASLKQQQAGVQDAGLSQAQSFQSNVEQQQNQLTQQLEASADPLSIAQSALGVASNIKAPSLFAPVGNFFSDWANQYGAQQQVTALNNNNATLNQALQSSWLGAPGTGMAGLGSSGVIG